MEKLSNRPSAYRGWPKNEGKILPLLLALLLLGGLLYLAYSTLSYFLSLLAKTEPSVAASIVGVMITAFTGIIGVLYTQFQIKKREIANAYRVQKRDMYEEFNDIVSRMMGGINKNLDITTPSEKEIIHFMHGFMPKLVLWGSPKVILSFLEFSNPSASDKDPLRILKVADKFQRAMREDLGLSNSGLHNNQLVKMYLSDPSEMD